MMRVYEIKNKYHQLKLLDHGATIYEWLSFSDKTSIVLNNQDMEIYKDSTKGFFGSTVGRVANRIGHGRFTLNDVVYDLPKNQKGLHTLHGGPMSFNTKTFEVVEHTDSLIKFRYFSEHLENGFPGDLIVYVTYLLDGPSLTLSYDASSNMDTILNLTNHAHFNLGASDILEHELVMHADRYLEIDDDLIPTGKIMMMQADEPLNFIHKKQLKEGILPLAGSITNGIDHAYLFKKDLPKELTLSYKSKSLKIETSYPGLQVYTMNRKMSQLTKDGKDIPLYAAVAFECQIEPDAINHPNFNSSVLKAGEKYHHYIKYTVNEEN